MRMWGPKLRLLDRPVLWLLVTCIALTWCFANIAQASKSKATGEIRVEVLLNGTNISLGCLGAAVALDQGEVIPLVPATGALRATVPTGQYECMVFNPEDASFSPQMFTLRVGAGETVVKTVDLGGGPPGSEASNAAPPSFSGFRPVPQGAGTESSEYNEPGQYPTNTNDDRDDDLEPQYDDEEDLPPLGEVEIQWKVTCQAEETDSYHRVAEFESDYLREESETSRISMQMMYSGHYHYQVTGIVDDLLDLGKESGEVALTGGGKGEILGRAVMRDMCFSEGKWKERDFTSTNETRTTYQARARENLSPPSIYIYPAGCKVSLPRFYEGLECRARTRTVSKTETCTGVDTDEFENTLPTGLFLCEMVIEDALASSEFKQGLEIARPDGTNWTVFGNAKHDFTFPRELSSSPNHTMDGQLELSYTITYSKYSEDPELVILLAEEYNKWLPEADEDVETPGNSISFEVELRDKNRPGALVIDDKATFQFQLVGTSREPGICLNYPSKARAIDSYDLIFTEQPGYLVISEDGQSAFTENYDSQAVVTVDAFDFGAYGRLQVTATTRSGRTVVGHLEDDAEQKEVTLPLDRNNNHIADRWEQEHGLYGRLPAEWDESPKPEDQKHPGDGISLFEKYRGFRHKVIGAGVFVHERLDPNWKHLFIFDPDGIVEKMETNSLTRDLRFSRMSRLRLRFIDDEHWTGPGSSAEGKRIINFNSGFGHATDQHGVHVVVTETAGTQLAFPPGYADALARAGKSAGTAPSAMSGMSWADYQLGFGPPKYTYRVDILPDLIPPDVIGDAKRAAALAASYGHLDAELYARKPTPSWELDTKGISLEETDQVRAEARAARNAWWKECEECGNRWVDKYVESHPEDLEIAVLRHTAIVLSHELAHSVGVQHHHHRGVPMPYASPGPSQGNLHCVVWIPDMFHYGGYEKGFETDPFYVRHPKMWPRYLCGDPEGGEDSLWEPLLRQAHDVGCWGQVRVSDRHD